MVPRMAEDFTGHSACAFPWVYQDHCCSLGIPSRSDSRLCARGSLLLTGPLEHFIPRLVVPASDG